MPRLTLLLLASVSCVVPCAAEGGVYSFTRIADVLPNTFPLGSDGPAINNQGDVAFTAALASSPLPLPQSIAVYRSHGQSLTTIYNPNPLRPVSGQPAINDSGVVVFRVVDGAQTSLLTGTGGPNPLIDSRAVLGTRATISNDGTIAYFASESIFSDSGIYTNNGTGPTDIAFSSALSGGHVGLIVSGLVGEPQISRGGTLAYVFPESSAQPLGPLALYLKQGSTTTPMLESLGLPLAYSVNDAGTVAYIGSIQGQLGLYAIDDGTTTPIVQPNPFPELTFWPWSRVSINNAGQVAFGAIDPRTGLGIPGIFTGPDPDSNKVITAGDELDGSTVTGISFGPNGLNDLGQIAFVAHFGGGRAVIYTATPVPEPSTVVLLALGFTVLAASRLRRQRS
ncbi:MAG: choice-of-anchor tandem repeat NxxGxxAF-containing protein [Pirellulales bacterium]